MTRQVFPTNNSILSACELARRVVPKYKLPQPANCYFLNPGLNDTYAVTAGSSSFVLRVYRHGWRSKGEILAELEMLVYLHKHQVPVSYPIERADGSLLTRLTAPEGVRYAALFTYACGQPLVLNDSHCVGYGSLLGQIHTRLDRWPADPRRFHLDLTYLIDEPLSRIEPYLRHRSKDFEFLGDVGEAMKGNLDGMLSTSHPQYGCCHGDHYGGNVHMDQSGSMTVFDFDCYGYGWRAYDLAVFLAKNAQLDGTTRSGKARSTRRWNAFLNGYSSQRMPSERELQAVQLFVPARLIWRIGMEARVEDWGRNWVIDGSLDRDISFIRYWVDSQL